MSTQHTQPEALRLADALGRYTVVNSCHKHAAAELRRLHFEVLAVREHRDLMCSEVTRLHELNAKLLGALQRIALPDPINSDYKISAAREALREIARAAIAKATNAQG